MTARKTALMKGFASIPGVKHRWRQLHLQRIEHGWWYIVEVCKDCPTIQMTMYRGPESREEELNPGVSGEGDS